jgi:poly(hydroxyalkanoate) granule-associated protein
MTRKNRTTRTSRTTRTTRTTKLQKFVRAAAGVRQNAVGAFDALVKQSRAAALDKAHEVRDVAVARAEEAKAKTVEAVNQLEKMFETRVSRAISKLGVPTTKDVRALSRQVAQLQASVDRLNRSRSRAAA